MPSHGVLQSLSIVSIVALLSVFSIDLQLQSVMPAGSFFYVNELDQGKTLKRISAPITQESIRCVRIDAERPYPQLGTVNDGDRGYFAIQENRSMCPPPPLVIPYITNRHPQPRVASDPRNIRPLTYENRTQVQKIRPPRHRLEYAGISKPRLERIYDTSFEKEVPQPRVDAIKRGKSKRRRPPATIYPTDQDCQGHVEKIRPCPSYLVR